MITPKFGIGDVAYTVDFYYDFWYPNETKFKVSEIISRIQKDKTSSAYHLKTDNYDCIVNSSLCFHSYDEAKQWCNEKNGENK